MSDKQSLTLTAVNCERERLAREFTSDFCMREGEDRRSACDCVSVCVRAKQLEYRLHLPCMRGARRDAECRVSEAKGTSEEREVQTSTGDRKVISFLCINLHDSQDMCAAAVSV